MFRLAVVEAMDRRRLGQSAVPVRAQHAPTRHRVAMRSGVVAALDVSIITAMLATA